MFCSKCGNQIKNGDKFCSECGTPIKAEASVTTPKAPLQNNLPQQPVQEIPSITSMTGMNAGQEIQKEKAKGNEQKAAQSNGKRKRLIIWTAALLFLSIVVLNTRQINNFLHRTFSSPKKYYQFVEKKTVDEFSETIGELYDSCILEMLDFNDKSYTFTLEAEAGSELKSILELLGKDISWLQNLGVSGNMAVKDNIMTLMAGVNVNKNELLSGNVVMDMENSDIYIQIPELSDQYVGMDAAFMNDIGITESFFEWKTLEKEILDACPDREKAENLINRYMKTALKQIKNVSKSKEKITVGDISQKFTVLEITVDDNTVKSIMKAVLTEMKNDKDVKSIMIDINRLDNAVDAEKAYEEFQKSIADILENLDDLQIDNQETKMTVYVDRKGRIKGRDIDTGYCTIKSMLTERGKNFAYELSYDDGIENIALNGSGIRNADVINGDFDLQYNDLSLDIKAQEFNVEGIKKGLLNGRLEVELTLPKSIIAELPAILAPLASTLSLQMNMDFESSETSYMSKLGLVTGKMDIGSVSLYVEKEDGKKASVPSTENAIMIEDMNDFCEWMKTIELSKLITAAKGSGLPSKVTDVLAMADKILINFSSGDLNSIITSAMQYGSDYYSEWFKILRVLYSYIE